MCPADDLTVWKKILLHLSRFSHHQQNAVYPFEITQDGIAEELGKSTGNVSVQLSRLMENGCVDCKVDHVEGARTRRKVYLITSKGLMIVESIRETSGKKPEKGGDGLRQADGPVGGKSVVKTDRKPIEDETTDSASTYSYSFIING